jgi:alpha-glucoside transport system substrate-binding protein
MMFTTLAKRRGTTRRPGSRHPATRRRAALAATAAATLLAGACSSGSKTTTATPTLTGGCAKYQAYAGHSGTKVTMFASIISPESDSLQKSWADFTACTGITVSYEGSNDFESQLTVRVTGGNAPDLAVIPQPGLLAQMVKTHKVVKPPQATVENESKWNAAWKAYGTVNGTFYAAPMSANMKSLVWYSPKAFTAAGYQVPTSWDQLMALSSQIAAAGKNKPWCGGIGSGTATGWPATDWLEEVVLRQHGGSVYDDWVSHKVTFSSPQIQQSLKTVADWMQNPAWVNGGLGDVKSIATTTFQDAGKPILTGKCSMLQQASFYEAQWPAGTKVAKDGDVFAFYLPPISPTVNTPVEGGGEFLTAFSSRPEVQAVQSYLSTAEWANARIKVAPGWVSANEGVDQTLYTDPIDQLSAKYLTDANATFRFDGSDLMPAAIGAGQEWTSMTAWFAQGLSVQQVGSQIDGAWPSP